MAERRVVIAADHLGLSLKDAVKAHLEAQLVEVVDLGGLTDPVIARAPGGHLDKRVPLGHLVAREPRTLLLHSARRPETDGEGRLVALAGYPVEQRVAVREGHAVTSALLAPRTCWRGAVSAAPLARSAGAPEHDLAVPARAVPECRNAACESAGDAEGQHENGTAHGVHRKVPCLVARQILRAC